VSGGGSGRLLDRLDAARTARPGPSPARLIERLSRVTLPDAESLIRYHEALIFLRAYPHDAPTLRRSEAELRGFGERIARFVAAGGHTAPFDDPEVSGIVGTAITTDYSFDVVRWMKLRHPRHVSADWEGFESPDRLRALWPRFLPLLEEEALEDANVPYREWLAAAGVKDDLAWLIEQVEGLPGSEMERAERYEALELSVRWELADYRASRTGLRGPSPRTFFHPGPLIARRDVSIPKELEGPPIPVRRLSRSSGQRAVDLARGATVQRYREYYGFTYADPATVRQAELGRGITIFLFGIERGRRLPLRAGFAAFFVKNGVPVGYVEMLAFFERVEIGFNVYYAFREGESAWIFARVLKLLRQVYGVTSFSIDPYQIGHENPEAIDSGAFWFYRKLGFHSTGAEIRRLTDAEEQRLAARPDYRSPPRTLRLLARRNVIYDADPSRRGEWDAFHIRNLGLAVQRRMGKEFGGDAGRMRQHALARVARILEIEPNRWRASAREALDDLALVWDLIPDLTRWSSEEKTALVAIARAKSGRDELNYLRRMQRHPRLREAMLRLGTD
jgi:hypothetical protein